MSALCRWDGVVHNYTLKTTYERIIYIVKVEWPGSRALLASWNLEMFGDEAGAWDRNEESEEESDDDFDRFLKRVTAKDSEDEEREEDEERDEDEEHKDEDVEEAPQDQVNTPLLERSTETRNPAPPKGTTTQPPTSGPSSSRRRNMRRPSLDEEDPFTSDKENEAPEQNKHRCTPSPKFLKQPITKKRRF
ncbi:hypothetical protein BC834DRAFT_975055 [Gloeopeniophorella convolvens]|nr:hypothetical protein BC834DRAFT_975055 [Gloeopeniophorella convolvens]